MGETGLSEQRHRPCHDLHPELECGLGTWDADVYGNHRILVRVTDAPPVLAAELPWRRSDPEPEQVDVLVLSPSGARVRNTLAVEVTRERGRIAFEPAEGPGVYAVHYLPYAHTGRPHYPQAAYRQPTPTADPAWRHACGLDRPGVWRGLPRAEAFRYEAVSAADSFAPLGFTATADERAALERAHPGAEFLLFAEDRAHPLGRFDQLPARWARCTPFAPHSVEADRGEYYALQVGVHALGDLTGVRAEVRGLPFPARCLSTGGTDARGRAFERRVSVAEGRVSALWFIVDVPEEVRSGRYDAEIAVRAEGTGERVVPLRFTVGEAVVAEHGTGQPDRLARLRWLDSALGHDDELVPPFTAVKVDGYAGNTGAQTHRRQGKADAHPVEAGRRPGANDGQPAGTDRRPGTAGAHPVGTDGRRITADRHPGAATTPRLAILGRAVDLGPDGLPHRLTSTFTASVTGTDGPERDLLAGPVTLDLGRPLDHAPLALDQPGPARVRWSTRATGPDLVLRTEGELEADGFLVVRATVEASADVVLDDVRLDVPVREEIAAYAMGLGLCGQVCPQAYDWHWDTPNRNQDTLWLGGPAAGVQIGLRDEHYTRPLNTNYYRERPLVRPRSWAGDDGRGGVRLRTAGGVRTLTAYSGVLRLRAGESRTFELRLLLTPFKPLEPGRHLAERYFHAYATPREVADYGATVVNLHHATPPNPYINDPLLAADELRAYIDEAHRLGVRVKVYDTVRELTRHTPELPVLASFGDEVLASGSGGGHAWLREHLRGDFVPGWVAPDVGDVAVVTSGESRWHNSYVHGIERLCRHAGVDGLYLDDVAYDRTTMKRVRKVLARSAETPPLIDLHSCNQYREPDGFASSANLYAELMPYTDRLWLGELFDYEGTDPAYWLVEISGIPFGLMGEMLEGGGNPWRGLVFGMTARAPMTDVRPLWRAFDHLRLAEAEMTGWWADEPRVRTGRDDVLATTWEGPGGTVTAVASWAPEPVEIVLETADGPVAAYAPGIEGFQPERAYAAGEPVPVAAGRGLLLALG